MNLSRPVFTAVHSLQESLDHFILFPFNFPFEGAKCIPLLRHAIELLLRAHSAEKAATTRGMKALVDAYGSFTESEDTLIRWLSDKRNSIMHEGEVDWEDVDVVSRNVSELFSIAGSLLQDLDVSFTSEFDQWHVELLSGGDLDDWSRSELYAIAAIGYAGVDEEIAIEIANTAFETALRLMASRWSVAGAETASLNDLISTLSKFDDERAPYYIDRRLDERDAWTEFGESRFAIPSGMSELSAIAEESQTGFDIVAKEYAQQIFECVRSYLERTPLEIATCVLENWIRIVSVYQDLNPSAEIPEIDRKIWGHNDFLGNRIRIPTTSPESVPAWNESDYRILIKAIEEVCGPVSKALHIQFEERLDWNVIL